MAELYVGNKGYEITYKGAHPIEPKDLEDYLRRRRFSLDTVLRTWVNDPGVVLLFEGFAIAAQHPPQQVTLINAQERKRHALTSTPTHTCRSRSRSRGATRSTGRKIWKKKSTRTTARSPGIMAPYNVTRFFNGDMASQRFLNSVTINQGLDQAMFDPNSGYNPNKAHPASDKHWEFDPLIRLPGSHPVTHLAAYVHVTYCF